jgi:hypothetical protein
VRDTARQTPKDYRMTRPLGSIEEYSCFYVVQVEVCDQDMRLTKGRYRVPAFGARDDEAASHGVRFGSL